MKIVDETRFLMAELLNANNPNNIIFAPSATIAANQIIMGLEWDEYKVVYVSPFEHNAIARPLEIIKQRYNITLLQLPFDGATQKLDFEQMEQNFALNPPDYVFINHMFIKDNLHPVMENIVLLHELGHDTLHREEATRTGGFEEFNIFEMQDNRMEYEANISASQVALPDDDFLELAERGYDTQQIARPLNSDINLVALKADTLISQGFRLRPQEHCNDFLRYNR